MNWSLPSLTRTVWTRRPRAKTPFTRRVIRPRLEMLEDRLSPATYTVNGIGDNGSGSGLTGDLRYCLTQANLSGGANTIVFLSTVFSTPQTITLQSALPAITDDQLTVQGPGAGLVTVSGNSLFQVFAVTAADATFSGLTIANGHATNGTNGAGIAFSGSGTLTLRNSVLTGNAAANGSGYNGPPGYGGAVYNSQAGRVVLTNSTLSGNFAHSGGGFYNRGRATLTGDTFANNTAVNTFNTGRTYGRLGSGGGLENQGSVTLSNSTFTGNYAQYGGGIFNPGMATLTNCTFSGNSALSGGGLLSGGTATLTACTLSGNGAYYSGGGIAAGGTLTVTNSTLSGNSGSGISNNGTLTVTYSTLSGNSGSGISNGGTLTVTNSTLSGNSGSGISNGGTLTVTNSTLSGNSAGTGGGIYNNGTLTVTNSTLSGNSAGTGGGIANGGTLTLNNTLVAANTAGSNPDLSGVVVSTSAFNLVGNGTGLSGINDGTNGNQIGTAQSPINALLAPLGYWGGPTQTQALLPGSPAIDAGSNALAQGTTDQRGFSRIVNGTVDIGATEVQGPATAVVNSAADNATADGVLTLREALEMSTGGLGRTLTAGEAAQIVSGDPAGPVTTVEFAASLTAGGPATIALQGALPVLSSDVTIQGPGENLLTVSGVFRFQVFDVTAANATFSGLTIADGTYRGNGAGIFFNSTGTLTLSNCGFSGNSASSTGLFGVPFSGGGLYNGGTATLTDCTFSGNSANYGGGLFNLGTVTLSSCTFSGNTASRFQRYEDGFFGGFGGGVESSGMATLTDCTLSGNSASVRGGGIDTSGTLTVTSSTLSGNSAVGDYASGGGIANGGTLTLTNSTLSGNSATGYYASGGGIGNGGTLTVTNSTLSGNSASGQYASGGGIAAGGTLTLNNTLVAANTAGSNPDISGVVASSSAFNLVGNGTGLSGINDGTNGNHIGTAQSPINPLLAPLGNYGGPTATFALLPGSPALAAGGTAVSGLPATDQRGFSRLRNGTVDIGAFESRGFTVTATAGDGQSATVATAFGTALTVIVNSSFGEPVAGGVVTFRVPGTRASAMLSAAQVILNSAGSASVTATANTVAGSYGVDAAADPAGAAAVFHLTNTPGAASHFQVQAPSSVTAGVAFSVTVTARDPYGNIATGYGGTVHFTCTDHATGVMLPANYTFLPGDKGKQTFSGLVLQTPGQQNLTVHDKANAGIKGNKKITVVTGSVSPDLVVGPLPGSESLPGTPAAGGIAEDRPRAVHQGTGRDFPLSAPLRMELGLPGVSQLYGNRNDPRWLACLDEAFTSLARKRKSDAGPEAGHLVDEG